MEEPMTQRPTNPALLTAEQLGLQYLPPEPLGPDRPQGPGGAAPLLNREHRVVGRIDDVAVNLVFRSGRLRPIILYGVVASPGPISMRITARPWWHRTLRWFGWVEDLCGDAEFDRRVWVRTRDREGAARHLTPERRELILRLLDLLPNARIVDGTIDAADRRSWLRPPDASEMAAAVEFLVATAAAVTADGG
jgi:hypothetical protein